MAENIQKKDIVCPFHCTLEKKDSTLCGNMEKLDKKVERVSTRYWWILILLAVQLAVTGKNELIKLMTVFAGL